MCCVYLITAFLCGERIRWKCVESCCTCSGNHWSLINYTCLCLLWWKYARGVRYLWSTHQAWLHLWSLMRRSCHNWSVNICVELGNLHWIWNILVVVFLNCSCEINFRAPSRHRKGCVIKIKIFHSDSFFFWHGKKELNK